MKKIKLLIDLTNIKAGGGITHIYQILSHFDNPSIDITLVGSESLNEIAFNSDIKKMIFVNEFSSFIKQEYFKHFTLKKIALQFDLVFAPGGTFYSSETPYITMSRNMLVFEEIERNRFPKWVSRLRYRMLEKLQVKSFKGALGVIYISNYAKDYITKMYPMLNGVSSTVIYHGISDDFRASPKKNLPITEYSLSNPFKILYVSIINYYKHQIPLMRAVEELRKEGFPVELELVGGINKGLVSEFNSELEQSPGTHYTGKAPYAEVSKFYKEADVFVFSSTCENMPNVLVEAMSAGLPILCSNFGPMPEILEDNGMYMNPLDVNDIKLKLRKILLSPSIRDTLANKAYNSSRKFSWKETSKETFSFITKLAKD